ncbi:hypothetical protein TYRP_006569 [Tyrophagus putrescentiae]|nr:hypothetical protein TYRP_006569 [Tyrophagus putrescentiae]
MLPPQQLQSGVILHQVIDERHLPTDDCQVQQGKRVGVSHPGKLCIFSQNSAQRLLVAVDHRLLQLANALQTVWNVLQQLSGVFAKGGSAEQFLAKAVNDQLGQLANIAQVQGAVDLLTNGRLNQATIFVVTEKNKIIKTAKSTKGKQQTQH